MTSLRVHARGHQLMLSATLPRRGHLMCSSPTLTPPRGDGVVHLGWTVFWRHRNVRAENGLGHRIQPEARVQLRLAHLICKVRRDELIQISCQHSLAIGDRLVQQEYAGTKHT